MYSQHLVDLKFEASLQMMNPSKNLLGNPNRLVQALKFENRYLQQHMDGVAYLAGGGMMA